MVVHYQLTLAYVFRRLHQRFVQLISATSTVISVSLKCTDTLLAIHDPHTIHQLVVQGTSGPTDFDCETGCHERCYQMMVYEEAKFNEGMELDRLSTWKTVECRGCITLTEPCAWPTVPALWGPCLGRGLEVI